MKKYPVIFGFFTILLAGASCTHVSKVPGNVSEVTKSIWGSSTRALNNVRGGAIVKKFNCSFDQCFDEVLELAKKKAPQNLPSADYAQTSPQIPTPKSESESESDDEEQPDASQPKIEQTINLFLKDKAKKIIVVMGVPGNIDTTEVGIFFTPLDNSVQLEVASLSTSAKIKASEIIFAELAKKYTPIE